MLVPKSQFEKCRLKSKRWTFPAGSIVESKYDTNTDTNATDADSRSTCQPCTLPEPPSRASPAGTGQGSSASEHATYRKPPRVRSHQSRSAEVQRGLSLFLAAVVAGQAWSYTVSLLPPYDTPFLSTEVVAFSVCTSPHKPTARCVQRPAVSKSHPRGHINATEPPHSTAPFTHVRRVHRCYLSRTATKRSSVVQKVFLSSPSWPRSWYALSERAVNGDEAKHATFRRDGTGGV